MLSILIVGCGRIYRKHADVLLQLIANEARVAVTAVLDTDKTRADKAAKEFSAHSFTDYKALEASGMCFDYSVILTPSGLHVKNALSIMPFSKNIIIEKPLALTLEDADEIIGHCNRAGKKLYVIKQNRLNSSIQYLKSRIDNGDFGKIALSTVRVRWCRPQSYYDQDSWRGTWEFDGGVLANQASHHLDLLQWLIGDVYSVFGYAQTQLVDIEAEDTAVAVLKFRNGSLGVIEATTAARPFDVEGSLSIIGEHGMIEIGGRAVNKVIVDTLPASSLLSMDEEPPDVYGLGHYKFYSMLFSDDPIHQYALVDGLEGRKSLELISGIYESAATGREVHLSFKSRFSSLGRSNV